jgi:hypothetical protein
MEHRGSEAVPVGFRALMALMVEVVGLEELGEAEIVLLPLVWEKL